MLGDPAGIEDKMIKLRKGDLILLYTDGFNDARNKSDEEYGRERILKLLEKNKNKTGDVLIKAISDDVSEFNADSPQFDDLTVITINYLP